jgi:hypothetical protein
LLNGMAPYPVVPGGHGCGGCGGCGNVFSEDVGLPVRFSGGLILCRNWIESFTPSLRSVLTWRFQRVSELQFEQGRLTNSVDCSARVARVREEAERYAASPRATLSFIGQDRDSAADQEFVRRVCCDYGALKARITACFARDYEA